MKRSLSLLLSLVTLATVGGVYKLMNAPIQIIHSSASCPVGDATIDAQEIEVLGTHRWDNGLIVVLYSALCPPKDGRSALERVLGHQFVRRDGLNWQVSSRDSYSINNSQDSSEKLIEYRVSQSKSKASSTQTSFQIFPFSQAAQIDRYTLVYGRILSPEVVAVEATFDDGQIVRASRDAKTFALLSNNSAHICELRVFGTGNQILRREDLAPPSHLWMPRHLVQHQTASPQCLPYSHQA